MDTAAKVNGQVKRALPPLSLPLQQVFIDAVRQQESSVIAVPADYPLLSFYSPVAFHLGALSVVVCADDYWVLRNTQALAYSGWQFPEVAALYQGIDVGRFDAVLKALNKRQVKLLFVSPEQFESLPVYQELVRQPLGFIGIEDAHCLLPAFEGSERYELLIETLQQRSFSAPLALFSLPVNDTQLSLLSQRLPLFYFSESILHVPLSVNHYSFDVQCFKTTDHMIKELMAHLLGPVDEGSYHRLTHPGKILIRVNSTRLQQRLAGMLDQAGVSPVAIYHDNLSMKDRLAVEQDFHRREHMVVISTSTHYRLLPPGTGTVSTAKPKVALIDQDIVEDPEVAQIIFAELPASLDELVSACFQKTVLPLAVTLMFEQSDYQQEYEYWLSVYQSGDVSKRGYSGFRLQQLKRLYRFVVSTQCRLKELTTYLEGYKNNLSDCGMCDNCIRNGQPKLFGGFFSKLLPHWL